MSVPDKKPRSFVCPDVDHENDGAFAQAAKGFRVPKEKKPPKKPFNYVPRGGLRGRVMLCSRR